MNPRDLLLRFGPRQHKERVGVPSDHFLPAERPNYRKLLREVKRQQARRKEA